VIYKGAVAILTAILTGLVAWGGTSIQKNNDRIIRLESRAESSRELLKEVRDDVKIILRKVK